MGRSDFRPQPRGRLLIPCRRCPAGLRRKAACPRRISQVPVSIFRRALSPITPDGSADAIARCFSADGRLNHLRQVGRRRFSRNEAEAGSLALGLASSLSGGYCPFACFTSIRAHSASQTGLPPTVGYPAQGDRSYMSNEQFTCLTPHSQIDGPDFAWRTEARERKERLKRHAPKLPLSRGRFAHFAGGRTASSLLCAVPERPRL